MNSPLYNFYVSPNNNNILSDLIFFLNNSSSFYKSNFSSKRPYGAKMDVSVVSTLRVYFSSDLDEILFK
jgi:hypothetical protein